MGRRWYTPQELSYPGTSFIWKYEIDQLVFLHNSEESCLVFWLVCAEVCILIWYFIVGL